VASNESETRLDGRGFTSFLEDFGLNEIADKVENPFTGAYAGYFQW
jgi:hypothetical protein